MTLHPRFHTAAAVAFALAHALPSQSPPPTGIVSTVGIPNQTQSGGPLGDQRIGAICAPSFYSSSAPLGGGGVMLGGSIAWWSEALHPTTQPLTLHAAGTCITLFLVAPFQFTSIPLPFAAPGHERLFEPPLQSVSVVAPWVTVLTTGGSGAMVPPGGYNRWFMTLDIPLLPSLLGSVWSGQSARIDGFDLQIYLSNEHLVQVWN